jgi:hypothetical protein
MPLLSLNRAMAMNCPPRAICHSHRIGRIVASVMTLALASCSDQPNNPLQADSASPAVLVIDPANTPVLDPLPPGWRHRKFWFRSAMRVSLEEKNGVKAVRCETAASGSIFGRWTDIDLARWPRLTWRWFVEVGIDSPQDERTREGDDHPVRFFLTFRDEAGAQHNMEIIWSNKVFKRGDWKYIGGFPHWVADGGDANTGRWRDEEADLLDLYRLTTKREDRPRLLFLGLFCDSDDTRTRSVAYTSEVRLEPPAR